MRALAMMVLAVGLLLGSSPASAGSTITGAHVVLAQAQQPPAECDCGRRPISSVDLAARLVYAALGAGAGYLYATMPVTTTAIAAAFAGGVITMWVYSSYYFKPAEPGELN
ncbi:hypothetical protein GCM10017083_21250 [Thalassobaculum fulvum]|uniref:Uncharacterized protein n=1 Tax=Thalassobaculum fulvum TaxID=1633335 RepID=A0A918XR92_9PROT|nr:hypothetical protein [Thalassobaculum fulvum]GHD49231.1 hypothetical protein GCM10017083_21250 [Thalassobaculum fulvum]